MIPFLRQLRLLLIPALFGAILVWAWQSGKIDSVSAADPRISAIAINGWTSTTATISFSVTGVADGQQLQAQVRYGATSQYGQTFPSAFAIVQPTDTVTLTNLRPGTSYHYQLVIRGADGTIFDQSADRTFSTRSGDTAASPVVTVQNIDCIDTSCVVTFTTATAANVTLGWDTVFRSPSGPADFCVTGSGYANCQSETPGFLATSRQLRMSNLTAGTTYHYRLIATAQNDDMRMTGNAGSDLQITTSRNSTDHTFSTGNCTEGSQSYPIGSCLPSGMICTTNGARQDCTSSCGFSCSTGSTCNASGLCLADPALTGTPTQCNKDACYGADGRFTTPAGANCYASWPKCTANTILKVQRDRGCNVWLTCGTSIQTSPAKNQPAENLCLTLAACNQIGTDGQCSHYLPQGQCDNDPMRFCSNDNDCTAGGTCTVPDPDEPTRNLRDLTYTTPSQVKQIANLSGSVVAGLDWSTIGGANVIQGLLPWQLMRQIGGSVKLKNGDFETNAPSVSPWEAVPKLENLSDTLQVGFEDKDSSINHVLKVTPVTQRIVRQADGTETTEAVEFSGAASQEFVTSANEYYYAEARIRAPSGNPIIRFELGHQGFTRFSVSGEANGTGQALPTYVDFEAGSVWQRVTIGPLRGLSGNTQAAIVCAEASTCAEFWVDDVQVKPILQINTKPEFVTPSCRLYPKEDSPSCDYTDSNGVAFKGWRGYCLENDSQTGNCLSWWPVDIIRGESSIFGTDTAAGYQDRTPLYYCAESSGNFVGAPLGFQRNMTTSMDLGDLGVPIPPKAGIYGAGSNYFPDSTLITNVTAQDQTIYENSIENILIDVVSESGMANELAMNDVYITKNSTYQSGCDNLFAGQPWSYCWHDTSSGDAGPDFVTVRFIFDPVDGHLTQIQAKALDGSSDNGAFYWLPKFFLKEQCNKLVQVVSPSGDTVAYSQRVNSRTTTVEGLNYGRGNDLTPFGAALPPADNTDNPELWSEPLSVQVKNPSITLPGQARAGAPYACVGNCGASQCSVASTPATANQCANTTAISNCFVNEDPNSVGITGVCVGVNSVGANNRSTQLFSPSQTSITIGSTAFDSYFAQNRLQRLFPQSLGIWSALRCSHDKTQVCLADADCGGANACNVQVQKYALVLNSKSVAGEDVEANFIGWTPPTALCPVTVVSAPSICTQQQLSCTAVSDTYTGPAAPSVQQAREEAEAGCKAQVACNGSTASCTTQGVTGTSAKFDGFAVGSCAEKLTNGVRTYTCTGRCTTSGIPYTNVNAAASTAPTVTKLVRPAAPDDYCAIPPSATNLKFTNASSRIAILNGGSGSVGVSFTSNADAEQVPLKTITIDWGDSQDTYSYPFAPKSDPRTPHIFSHVYNYNRGDRTHCAVDGSCVFNIKVQVKDNWGWCSEAAVKWCANANKTCSASTDCPGGAACDYRREPSGLVQKCQESSSTYWQDTGLQVVVNP